MLVAKSGTSSLKTTPRQGNSSLTKSAGNVLGDKRSPVNSPRSGRQKSGGLGLEDDYWHSYTVISGPVDTKMLTKWENTIKRARSAGQFSCSLMVIKEGIDYMWMDWKFSFLPSSSFYELSEWAKQQRVQLIPYVPKTLDARETDAPAKYPGDYCRFGYLKACWFEPYVQDAKPDDNEGMAGNMTLRLRDFDVIRKTAQIAGQTQCSLMMISEDIDYTVVRSILGKGCKYELTKRFDPVVEWAQSRNMRLVVRVPENTHLRVRPTDAPVYCSFGYLVADWEIPL